LPCWPLGAVPRVVGTRLGRVLSSEGQPVEIETTIEAMPSVLWDAVVLPDGEGATATLATNADVQDFVKEQYRHGKPLLVLGRAGVELLRASGVQPQSTDEASDPALVMSESQPMQSDDAHRFVAALGNQRQYERELQLAAG